MKRWFLSALLLAGCATVPFEYAELAPPRAVEITPLKLARPVVGLVLGAGGARGFAHIGVIKVLESAGIHSDVVVGVSSGAIVASLYAGGYGPARLEAAALDIEDSDLLDYTLFGPGIVQGERLQEFVNRLLANRSIEALDKPFVAVATESQTHAMTIFNRGNTGLAVRASAAVPKIFWPVLIQGHEYVDGGLASRVPAPVARKMGADVVIAVDVSWRGSADAAAADVVIRPDTTGTRLLDFNQKRAGIAAGEQAARAALPEIMSRIARAQARKAQRVTRR